MWLSFKLTLQFTLWLIIFPFQFVVTHVLLRALSVPAVFFAKKVKYTTTVKLYDKQVVTLMRFRLPWWLSYLDTPDNATDEYLFGVYFLDSIFAFARNLTLDKFENSRKLQLFCMMAWLQRNCGYGFAELCLGFNRENPIKVVEKGKEDSGKWFKLTIRPSSFQLEAQFPLFFGKYNSMNIGWKEHKGSEIVAYAGRPIGLKSY